MKTMDQRLGRLREPRYLASYLFGGLLSAICAFAVMRISDGARADLAGAVLLGGVALSAQLAKGSIAKTPRRAAAIVMLAIVVGAVLGRVASW